MQNHWIIFIRSLNKMLTIYVFVIYGATPDRRLKCVFLSNKCLFIFSMSSSWVVSSKVVTFFEMQFKVDHSLNKLFWFFSISKCFYKTFSFCFPVRRQIKVSPAKTHPHDSWCRPTYNSSWAHEQTFLGSGHSQLYMGENNYVD